MCVKMAFYGNVGVRVMLKWLGNEKSQFDNLVDLKLFWRQIKSISEFRGKELTLNLNQCQLLILKSSQ